MPLLTLSLMYGMFFHILKNWFAFSVISGSSSCLVVSAPSHACSFMHALYVFLLQCLLLKVFYVQHMGFVSLFVVSHQCL